MNKKQIIPKPELTKFALSGDGKVYERLKTTLGIIIAITAFLLYAQSIFYDYNLDDSIVIQANKVVQQGVAGIPILIKTDRLFGLEEQALRTPEYRPASLVMFAIEWQLSPNNPLIGHLMNVLLYALTCWLLYQLLCKLFRHNTLLFPFVCALLYTLHPIHTEVVDNIKSRDELLCFLFGIIAVHLFLKEMNKPNVFIYLFAAVCYFISLASKETGISFLIIIPMVLFVFSKADARRILSVSLILVITTTMFLFIRYEVLESVPITNFNLNNNSLSIAPDFISREATAFYVLLRYVMLLIFPHPLCYDYSFNQIQNVNFGNPFALVSILVYICVGVYAAFKIRQREVAAFAILFYLLTIIPIANVFLLIGSSMSERFLYMPSLGYCMLLTLLLMKLTKPKMELQNARTIREFIAQNSILFTVVFIIGGLYSMKTITRNSDWKNSISLNGHDVEISTNSARTHFLWGISLLTEMVPKEQNISLKKDLLNHAVKEFKTTLSIFPNYTEAHLNLADAFMKLKNYSEAIKEFEITRKMQPKPNPVIITNLAYMYSETGQFEEAIGLADELIREHPELEEGYGDKGAVYFKIGDYEAAIPCFKKVLELHPNRLLAHKMLGKSYLALKDYEKALEAFGRAESLAPRDAEIQDLLEMAHRKGEE